MAHGVTPQSGLCMTRPALAPYTHPDDPPQRYRRDQRARLRRLRIARLAAGQSDVESRAGRLGEDRRRGVQPDARAFSTNQTSTDAAFNAQILHACDPGKSTRPGTAINLAASRTSSFAGGRNSHPAPIEALALLHRPDDQAAAFRWADPRLGERWCLAPSCRAAVPHSLRNSILGHLGGGGVSISNPAGVHLVLEPNAARPPAANRTRELMRWVEDGRVQPTRPLQPPVSLES